MSLEFARFREITEYSINAMFIPQNRTATLRAKKVQKPFKHKKMIQEKKKYESQLRLLKVMWEKT